MALGKDILIDNMESHRWNELSSLSPTFIELLRQYYYVGGMPAVVKSYVDKKLGKFTAADVLANCPSIGRTSVFNALKKLVEEGYIEKYGEKQQAYYVKKSTFAW